MLKKSNIKRSAPAVVKRKGTRLPEVKPLISKRYCPNTPEAPHRMPPASVMRIAIRFLCFIQIILSYIPLQFKYN